MRHMPCTPSSDVIHAKTFSQIYIFFIFTNNAGLPDCQTDSLRALYLVKQEQELTLFNGGHTSLAG